MVLSRLTKKGLKFSIDEQDKELVDSFVWRIDHGYVRNKETYLHRLILNFPNSKIDHIDGNPLNNSRSNLRICSQQQNTMNKKKTKKSSSKYKGVSWLKRDKKWYASIMKDYRTYNLGNYSNEVDAAIAYDKMAIKLFGQYARTNFINI